MSTLLRPSTILPILSVAFIAAVPVVTATAEESGPPSVLDDSDQAVPANDLYPFRHDGPIMGPIFRPTRMLRSDFWIIETLKSWKFRAAVQLGRYSFNDEVEESVQRIR